MSVLFGPIEACRNAGNPLVSGVWASQNVA
jgi:hypothetical protein